MQRYKMVLEYDGTAFHGYQVQPNQRTVQGTIEEVLKNMTKGQEIKVHGSGRTDAGVHAIGQTIHFDLPLNIPCERMINAMNSQMPRDILFKSCEIVDENFHVRYSAKGKWYRYIVDLDHFVNPFKRFYTGHFPYQIDLARIKEASQDLLGEHDFTSFAASGGAIVDKVRTIYYVNVDFDAEKNELILDFIGNGFLYNMVRIMTALLLEIGSGKRPVGDVKRVIAAKNRLECQGTAPASGLYLYRVFYEEIPEIYRMDREK